MKSKFRLLVGAFTFALALVFVAFGYTHSTFTSRVATAPAGPMLTFDDYSKMNKKRDRTAAFAKESALNRSLLWRQHLNHYQAKMQLNQQQRDFLRRVSQFLDEQFFAAPVGMSEAKFIKTDRGKPLKELMQNVSSLFTPEQTRQLFLTIGDTSTITDWGCGGPKAAANNSNGANDPYGVRAHGPNSPEPEPVSGTGCNCTGSVCGSGCTGNTRCLLTLPSLCDSGGSCGCFGWFTCDAYCFDTYSD